MGVELSIIMPCYNEEATLPISIPPLLELLDKEKVSYEVILVNNGSYDSTPTVIDSFTTVRRVDVLNNEGYGKGVIAGVKAAKGECVAYMGADGQITPRDFMSVWEIAKKIERHTIVKGLRIVRTEGFSRSFPSWVFNILFAQVFGQISYDVNGTPKCLHREDFISLNIESKNSFIDPELLIKAKLCNYRVIEVPLTFYPRSNGTSTVKVFSKSIEFIKEMIRWRLRL